MSGSSSICTSERGSVSDVQMYITVLFFDRSSAQGGSATAD